MNDQPAPLEVELLVSVDARRNRQTDRLITAEHTKDILWPNDKWVGDDDDDTVIDPFDHRAGSRRSDREVNRLLSVLDNLDRKAPTQ